jgi:hypothetical protein
MFVFSKEYHSRESGIFSVNFMIHVNIPAERGNERTMKENVCSRRAAKTPVHASERLYLW